MNHKCDRADLDSLYV